MTPLPPVDRRSADALWVAYAAAHPERVSVGERPSVEAFGDSVEHADRLLGLVMAGTKRTTASLVGELLAARSPMPQIGGHWMVRDGVGTARLVLRVIELRIGVLDSVDDDFAEAEGDGSKTRDEWIESHRRYFMRTEAARGRRWSDSLEVVFERFTVVWPPELAD